MSEPLPVLTYKDTGLKYLQGTRLVLFEKGSVLLTADQFKSFDEKGILVAQVLNTAKNRDRTLYDFSATAKEGSLVQVSKQPVDGAKIAKDTAKAEPTNEAEKKAPESKSIVHVVHSTWVIELVVGIVGLISLVMSGYHVSAFISMARPLVIGIGTGVAMGLFSAIAFTTGRYFFKQKGSANKSVSIVTYAFGVIVVVFAMFSTMTVNFDAFREHDAAIVTKTVDTASVVKTNVAHEADLRATVAKVKQDLSDAKAAAAPYMAEVRRMNDLMATGQGDTDVSARRNDQQWRYDRAMKTVTALQEKFDKYNDQLLSAPSEAQKAVDTITNAAQGATIYGMFAKLFGIGEDALRFVVYVIPAIFYDIMSPFALTMVLILDERRRKEKDEDTDR